MSMLCYFILWRGDAVVKGIKGRGGDTRNCTRLIQIFRIDIFFLRNTLNSISILSGIFLPRSRVGRSISKTECFPQRKTRCCLVH